MDSVFALKGKDFVVFVADSVCRSSIMALREEDDKVRETVRGQAMIVTGDPGDVTHFREFIHCNLRLLALRKEGNLSVGAAANYIRSQLAKAIRENPYQVNLLYGGVNALTGTPSLYFIDYMGTLGEDRFAVQNYSMYFLLGALDKYWKPDMNKEEAMEVVKRCLTVLARRFLLQPTKFVVKFVYLDRVEREAVTIVPENFDAQVAAARENQGPRPVEEPAVDVLPSPVVEAVN